MSETETERVMRYFIDDREVTEAEAGRGLQCSPSPPPLLATRGERG